MRQLRKNRRDLGLLCSEIEDDPRGFENISNGVPGTPSSFTSNSYAEAVSKEGEEEQNVATTAKRSHSKKATQEEFVRNGLISSDEEGDIRVVKLPIQSEAPEKLPTIQDTNRLINISSEDEAMSIRREVADDSQGIDMSTFRSLHRDISNLSGFVERSNGPRGRETLMSSSRYANTAPRRSNPSSPRSQHGCVKDEILDGYNYRPSSGSRSRHHDEASRSRHYDAASGHRGYSSRSRHRDKTTRARSRHRNEVSRLRSRRCDGPSRSRSRHHDGPSRLRSRHHDGPSRSRSRHHDGPSRLRSRHRDGPSRSRSRHYDGPSRSRSRHHDGPSRSRSRHYDGPSRSRSRHHDGPSRSRSRHYDGPSRSRSRHYDGPSRSRSRHHDGPSRSRSRHYDGPSKSRSRHRDGPSRSRSRHYDGPSRSRSRHHDGPSRSRSRHYDGPSRSRSRHHDGPSRSRSRHHDGPSRSRSRHHDGPSRSRSRHYDGPSRSRSRHHDGPSRSRSRHHDGPSRSRSRHRDGPSRSRSRHHDGPSRSRSRHHYGPSRSRSRHHNEAFRSKNRGWTFPLPQDVFQRELFNILFDIRNRLTSDQPIPPVVHIDKMETMEDFVREEERLSDPKVFETFVMHVSRIGGKNTKDFVNKVLDRLFTNALMAKFNMKGKGKRGKKPLENTMVYKAIKDGIMTGDWAATEDLVRLYAAEHLKHAPHRTGGRGRQLTEDR